MSSACCVVGLLADAAGSTFLRAAFTGSTVPTGVAGVGSGAGGGVDRRRTECECESADDDRREGKTSSHSSPPQCRRFCRSALPGSHRQLQDLPPNGRARVANSAPRVGLAELRSDRPEIAFELSTHRALRTTSPCPPLGLCFRTPKTTSCTEDRKFCDPGPSLPRGTCLLATSPASS